MKILIADDHPLYLCAVSEQMGRMFPQASISIAKSLSEIQNALTGALVDLILVDYGMPGIGSVSGIEEVVKAAKGAPIMVMSGIANSADIMACIQVGAKGFLPKTLESEIFASAINVILAGGSYLPAEMFCTPPLPLLEAVRGHENLNERERTILEMVVAGKSNKEIARLLELREVTIKVQLTRIYKKLGAKNRAQAAMLVTKDHLID